VLSSDLSRAVETAAAIRGTRPVGPRSAQLREIHFGAWEDRSHDAVAAEAHDHIFAFWDQPGSIAAPDGESWNDLRARTDAFVDGWQDPGPVIAVAHLGVIVGQIQRALDIPARAAFAHRIDNLSVTHLHKDAAGQWQTRVINHLP